MDKLPDTESNIKEEEEVRIPTQGQNGKLQLDFSNFLIYLNNDLSKSARS